MNNSFQQYRGFRYLEHLGADSGFPPQLTDLPRFQDSVTVLGQKNGNHRDPNEFRYEVRRKDFWHGGSHLITDRLSGKPQARITGVVGGAEFSVPGWDNRDAAYALALDRLNEKVRGGLDLGVDLAEAGQTRRMIKSLDRVTKFAKISRVGHGLADASRALANGWLEWQYGWRPLVQDVFDAADEGLNIILKRLRYIKARGTIPTEKSISYSGQLDGVSSVPMTEKIKGKQSCTIGMYLEVPEKRFDPARWSSLNPISLAWEVIPYSFVVDWFIDVGSTIRNFETALLYGTQFRSGYVSELLVHNSLQEHGNFTAITGGFPFEQVHEIKYFKAQLSFSKFERSILLSYPFPRPPHFKADLGSQRLLSAAALLRQLLKH